mmetsp:Transcript_20502/g.58560  ORF Transcript_20502/g.58560 Transcript_20502/m.58560 type:complete len:429 (+) Transcript_20502:592-1878(+)
MAVQINGSRNSVRRYRGKEERSQPHPSGNPRTPSTSYCFSLTQTPLACPVRVMVDSLFDIHVPVRAPLPLGFGSALERKDASQSSQCPVRVPTAHGGYDQEPDDASCPKSLTSLTCLRLYGPSTRCPKRTKDASLGAQDDGAACQEECGKTRMIPESFASVPLPSGAPSRVYHRGMPSLTSSIPVPTREPVPEDDSSIPSYPTTPRSWRGEAGHNLVLFQMPSRPGQEEGDEGDGEASELMSLRDGEANPAPAGGTAQSKDRPHSIEGDSDSSSSHGGTDSPIPMPSQPGQGPPYGFAHLRQLSTGPAAVQTSDGYPSCIDTSAIRCCRLPRGISPVFVADAGQVDAPPGDKAGQSEAPSSAEPLPADGECERSLVLSVLEDRQERSSNISPKMLHQVLSSDPCRRRLRSCLGDLCTTCIPMPQHVDW